MFNLFRLFQPFPHVSAVSAFFNNFRLVPTFPSFSKFVNPFRISPHFPSIPYKDSLKVNARHGITLCSNMSSPSYTTICVQVQLAVTSKVKLPHRASRSLTPPVGVSLLAILKGCTHNLTGKRVQVSNRPQCGILGPLKHMKVNSK